MLPLDVHPDPEFHPPVEGLEIGESEFAFGRSGKRRPGERFSTLRLGRHEVHREELESNPSSLLVQGVRTPLLEVGIIDPPRLEHASRESRSGFDDTAGPIGEHRWHALLADGFTSGIESLVVSIGLELEPVRARRRAARSKTGREQGDHESAKSKERGGDEC